MSYLRQQSIKKSVNSNLRPLFVVLTPSQRNISERERHLSQDYKVPLCVSIAIDADVNQANAVAITTALFAGGLLTLAQTITGATGSGISWEVLRFFTYSAIIVNLTGTFICLITIKMCTDLPHRAQQAVLLNRNSWPAKIAIDGEALPENILTSHYVLLETFGMSEWYRWIDTMVFSTIVFFGFLYSFIALVIWVWVSQSYVTAGVTMVTAVPALACAMHVLVAALKGQGWR